MYEIDPKPNSDQEYCENCETIVDAKMVIYETIDGEPGCTECIARCGWCGHYYFREDMYDNPYLSFVCWKCEPCEDYQNASEAEITKDALQCLFDQTPSRQIENMVISLAQQKGYFEFANDLTNDKS